jgi:hypothetical protein
LFFLKNFIFPFCRQSRLNVNNQNFTPGHGAGYDLARSLLERLALKGYLHNPLDRQYRMRPEIACLVRSLNYPYFSDAPQTQDREDIRGLQDNLVFINHNYSESSLSNEPEGGSQIEDHEKMNQHEAGMVVNTLRYLLQQVCPSLLRERMDTEINLEIRYEGYCFAYTFRRAIVRVAGSSRE